MNHDLESQIQDYLDKIAQKIPKDYPNKQKILQMVKHDLYAYIEEHPSADFKDLTEEFGTASEIAASLIKDLSGTDINVLLAKKKRRKKFLLFLCILLFIVLFFLCKHLYSLWEDSEIIFEKTLSVYDTELDIE